MEENKEHVQKHTGERYVPEGIARDILLRLPGKSLVRFKSVCKNWRNMISDPGFEDINFQQLISKIMIVCETTCKRRKYILLFKLEERGTKARKVTSWCFKTKYPVVAAKLCNSLILLRSHLYGSRQCVLYLYDTITHRQKILPELPKLDDDSPLENLKHCSSLMYDASGQKYKVVAFNYDGRSNGLIMCYIYSFNTKDWWKKEKWKKSKPPHSQSTSLICSSSIAFNGVFYWIVRPEGFLQPMNIATEEFMEIIQLPCRPRYCNLLDIKGSLCLINATSDDELEIWVLKNSIESIWVNQYKISFSSIVNRPSTLIGVKYGFTPMIIAESCNSNSAYILVSHDEQLYWYNMNTQEMKLIDVECESGSRCLPDTASLIDSHNWNSFCLVGEAKYS